MSRAIVVTNFDASFAQEEGLKSQAGYVSYITTEDIKEKPAVCDIIEFQSVRIDRVVKSTMAAESAALSKALDRQLYARLVFESVLHGEPEFGPNWRHQLKIQGIVVTDAKSLYDHLNATGSVPHERQTLIDLLIARDLSEHNALQIKWVPTAHQLADCLTKMMKLPPTMQKFLYQQEYSLTMSTQEAEQEEHLKSLRQGQRQRRKARDEQKKSKGKTYPNEA